MGSEQLIQRPTYTFATSVQHMSVYHRDIYIAVTTKLLHCSNVVAALQQVGCE